MDPEIDHMLGDGGPITLVLFFATQSVYGRRFVLHRMIIRYVVSFERDSLYALKAKAG